MALINLLAVTPSLLAQLADPALRSLALAVAAGCVLIAFRVKTTSAQLFTWTTVLYAALAMPLLGWMLPPVHFPAPAFLQRQPELPENRISPPVIVLQSSSAPITSLHARPHETEGPPATDVTRQANSNATSSISWGTLASAIYLAGMLLFLARIFVGLACGRRLTQSSPAIDDSRVTARVASRARAAGLSFIPRIAESECITVPVTMGAIRSTILLPTGWREWDDTTLDAVIAHEMSHVTRRDALTQRLSLIHRAIFWPSPLAWWLDRHLADLAEQASDEAALSCGVDCKDYARTLLSFFEALQSSPGRVWWQGVSMAKAGQAEQRLERILAWKGSVTMHFKKSIVVMVIALAVPVIYLAASAQPVNRAATTQDGTPAPSASISASLVAPAAPHAQPAIAGIAPVAPVSTLAYAQTTTTSSGGGYVYSYGDDDDLRFVIASGKSDSLTMSGSSRDAHRVQELRKTIPGDFIWFRIEGKPYIIRDQATIDRARAFWAPQDELGKKQDELGKQQDALGEQQDALGKKMEAIRVNVPDMTAELDKLRAELKQLGPTATMDQLGNVQSRIGDLQSKIGDIESHAGEEQGKLGEEMGALGEKQGKLGEQQGKLGEEQGRLAEQATKQMKQLLDEAITKGTAQPEPAKGTL